MNKQSQIEHKYSEIRLLLYVSYQPIVCQFYYAFCYSLNNGKMIRQNINPLLFVFPFLLHCIGIYLQMKRRRGNLTPA